MKKIGIVIVNYNGEEYQNDCIKSLYDMKNLGFDIILVDSGSTDNSVELVRKKYKEVIVLEQGQNVGYAAGCNIGIRYCIDKEYQYVMLLNNDVEVDENLLDNMLASVSENVVVVPKIYYYSPHDMIWFGGGKLEWKKASVVHFGLKESDNGKYDQEKIITFAPGCCMLIPTKIFRIVGLLDEKLFMYYEDTDFCVRLQEKGMEIIYQPRAYIWHKVSSSTGGEESRASIYYQYRNQLYYMHKYKEYIPVRGKIYAMCRAAYKYVFSIHSRNNNRMILEAYRDYFKGKMGRKDL